MFLPTYCNVCCIGSRTRRTPGRMHICSSAFSTPSYTASVDALWTSFCTVSSTCCSGVQTGVRLTNVAMLFWSLAAAVWFSGPNWTPQATGRHPPSLLAIASMGRLVSGKMMAKTVFTCMAIAFSSRTILLTMRAAAVP